MSREPLDEAVRETIEGNSATVAAWLRGEAGAWGALAGKAVVAYRRRLGRALTDAERRQVWQALWQRLTEVAEKRTP